MDKIQIKYNPAIEFLCSISRIIYNKEIKSKDWTYEFNKDIQEYVDNVINNMSTLMKNDMFMLTKKNVGGLVVPINLCLQQGISDLDDFFKKFSNLSGSEYFKMYTEVFEIDDLIDGDPAVIVQKLKDTLNWEYPSEDDIYFPEFMKYPDEVKNRLESFFKLYYDKFYNKIEDKPVEFMRDKLGNYKRQYEADGDEFLTDLLTFDINTLKDSGKQVIIYPSYFYEVGATQHNTKDSLCLLFGYLLEQRVNVDFKGKKAREVIKLLSDEKRYEILKLLGRDEHYGSQISDTVKLTKATVSYHINKMVSLGLLNLSIRENNRTYMSLNKKSLKEILDYIYQDLAQEKK